MKCQNLFTLNNEKQNINCRLLTFLSSMLSDRNPENGIWNQLIKSTWSYYRVPVLSSPYSKFIFFFFFFFFFSNTVKSQWLEQLWDHGNLFETWIIRDTEG